MFVFVAASLESATNQAFGRWIVLNWSNISPEACVMEQAPGWALGTQSGTRVKCVVRASGIVFWW